MPAWDSVREAARDTVLKQAEALAALNRVQAAFDRGPYPKAGVGIGNLISLDWPDFGKSFSIGRPVLDLIGEALPVTLLLNLVAIPIIYLVAVPFGIHAASRHNRWFDKVSGTVFVMFWSIPVVWAGVLAIGFLADKDYLGWLPRVCIRTAPTTCPTCPHGSMACSSRAISSTSCGTSSSR